MIELFVATFGAKDGELCKEIATFSFMADPEKNPSHERLLKEIEAWGQPIFGPTTITTFPGYVSFFAKSQAELDAFIYGFNYDKDHILDLAINPLDMKDGKVISCK